MFSIIEAEYDWAVPAGFSLDRTDGTFSTWIMAQYFGELELHVESKTIEQTTNTLLILPPDTPHGYICHAPMSRIWIDTALKPTSCTVCLRCPIFRISSAPSAAAITATMLTVWNTCVSRWKKFYCRPPYRLSALRRSNIHAAACCVNCAMRFSIIPTPTGAYPPWLPNSM